MSVPTTPETRILSLKICDPACGSGHFLIAAANRMARALASIRSGEEEPPPAAIQQAKRDVISRCIYGVDINPMAVELCKVNLWMEALEPGKPLSFLDHRILVGNSLLGTTPALMREGIPDDAFKPIEGDEKDQAAALRKRNREERKQREAGVLQLGLFDSAPPADYAYLAGALQRIDAAPDDTLAGIRDKEARYAALARDPEYIKARLLADAWCAAFVWEKRPSPPQSPSPSGHGGSSPAPDLSGHSGRSSLLPEGEGRGDEGHRDESHTPPLTDLIYRRLEDDPLAPGLQPLREQIVALAQRYQFFHWHVAFPDVFTVNSPHPESFSQEEKDFLRRGTRDAELYESIASKAMVEISRDLRQRQTSAEEIMWEALRNRRLNNLKFRRQHPVAETQYVVDFLCYEARLIVEIDGGVHDQQRQADAQRQREIEALGYQVIRFTNDDVYNDLQWVLANIAHAAQLPSPPGRRAGDEGFAGFDCVLGNPPWERIKIQEKEWFAERAPQIASAANADARKRMIADLSQSDPWLYAEFLADLRKAEGESHFVRISGRYPLCGRGDVNTYTIFAETARQIISAYGRAGMIVPSGIATDDTTRFFFQDLMDTQSLVSLYDFENRDAIFPGVHRSYKFALVTMQGLHPHPPAPSPSGRRGDSARDASRAGGEGETEFAFFLHSVDELQDEGRRFTLSAQDIVLINPNTRTMATFRSVRDAEITKAIYRRVPVLIQENSPLPLGEGPGVRDGEGYNPWGISFLRMFDMSNDSGLFHTREELEAAGFVLQGNWFVRGDEHYLPLYEGRLGHQFNHRFASEPSGNLSEVNHRELADPQFSVETQYFVGIEHFRERVSRRNFGCDTALLGFRRVSRNTDERTSIACLFPFWPASYGWILSTGPVAPDLSILCANYNSFVFDYTVRNSLSQPSIPQGTFQQLPVIPPHTYTPALLDFIVPRVLELSYTAWDLQPFALDVGYDGPPFVWDEERRFLMRCELDALYFHLYQISRDDLDYIMETFPIVKRKDIKATSDENGEGGEYLTRRIILEMYDTMAALPQMAVPAPKDESATYAVPDVSQWVTWLNPPPADAGAAHEG